MSSLTNLQGSVHNVTVIKVVGIYLGLACRDLVSNSTAVWYYLSTNNIQCSVYFNSNAPLNNTA